jgi:Pyruvate/2-oxoacid:ferredoxin oxidoreductase delta subunit
MIELTRNDFQAIYLRFDSSGIEVLINELKKLKIDGYQSTINIMLDTSVITLKKCRMEDRYITILKDNDIKLSVLEEQEGKLTWKLDNEDIDYAIERFYECKVCKYFSPPEFIRVKVSKNKKVDYMYCEFI